MAGYKGGHILRIKVVNFMTYDELELFPKRGLNLIIGLNGSGKSSIMCAICLGLAGKPVFTGRSSQLTDFIKYGCDKATVEIELDQRSNKSLVITRIIQSNGSSTWLLNKSTVSLGEVQQAVKKFNIDVSNLCQFLPQEKVTEFSKMDKKQRLENMLQAIGEPHLYTLFKELKQLKIDSMKLEDQKVKHQNLKDAEDQTNQRLKVEVDKQETKLRMKEHLKSLNNHKMVLEYNDIRKNLEELKTITKPIKVQSEKAKKELQLIIKQKEDRSNAFVKAVEDIKSKKTSCAKYQEYIKKKEAEFAEVDERVHKTRIDYQTRLEERRNQVAKMSEIKTQLKALEELCKKNALDKPKYEMEDRKISAFLEDIKVKLASLTSTHTYLLLEKNKALNNITRIEAMIVNLKSEENKKLEVLKYRYKDVYDATLWLQENNDKFKAKVFPPMLLLLNVERDDNRKYIEHIVAVRDLIAFLCVDKEDNKLLTTILKEKKRLNVNVVMVPEQTMDSYRSKALDRNLRNMGIQCFVKDIISAPDPVICFLCQCYGLHRIPLCASTAEQNMNQILDNFRSFFTPDALFSGKRSKYGDRNLCIRRDQVRSRNILPGSKDNSELLQQRSDELKKEKEKLNLLMSEMNDIDYKMKEFEKEENSQRTDKRIVTEKIKDIDNAVRQYQQKKQSYDKKKSELIDEDREKFQVKTLILGMNQKKMELILKITEYLENFIAEKEQKLKCSLKARIICRHLKELEEVLTEKKNQIKEFEERLEELKEKRTTTKAKGEALYIEIQKFILTDNEILKKNKSGKKKCDSRQTSKMASSSDENLPNDDLLELEEEKFLQNYSSLEEINKEIRHMQAQLDLNCDENEAVVAEFNERAKKIAEMQKEVENYDKNLQRLQNEIINKKNQWLPALQNHIRNINSKFSQYYKQLKCAGEISLDTCNNTDDFPKYGLRITLKYRDSEPFQELSNTHHSGGECSVAAIIFILSLQELTEVPFRCIDEINQGMDSNNERNIYSLIADSAKGNSCSQYFLLTPKLLMDLEMIEHRDVAVHVIYNSYFLEMEMNVQKHLQLAGRN